MHVNDKISFTFRPINKQPTLLARRQEAQSMRAIYTPIFCCSSPRLRLQSTAQTRAWVGGEGIRDFWVQWTPGRRGKSHHVILTTVVTEAHANWTIGNTAGFGANANNSTLDYAAITVYTVGFYRATLSVCPSLCPSVCHTRGLCPHGSTYDHGYFTTW